MSDHKRENPPPRHQETPAAISAKATHPDPDPRIAGPILRLTAGDAIHLRLVDGHSFSGRVLEDIRTPSSTLFDTPAKYRLLFESAEVHFQLTLWYRDRNHSPPVADAIDLRLVEGRDWSVPITPGITAVRNW